MVEGIRIGEVTHFFTNINVAVIQLTASINMGDMVHFLGRTTDFRQEVRSLQIEHQPISTAEAGQEVAMRVTRRVRRGDKVFRLVKEE